MENNTFILLLRKGVYKYVYMDDWGNFSDISLPEKEDFYSNLNVKDITGADFAHAKLFCKDIEINKL